MGKIHHTSLTGHAQQILIILLLAAWPKSVFPQTINNADSLMAYVRSAVNTCRDTVSEYKASLYTRAIIHIDKRNFLFRFLPDMLNSEKNIRDYLIETYRDIHYTNPGIYDQKLRYINGTVRNQKNIPGAEDFFRINPYKTYMLNGILLSPVAVRSKRYYNYQIDSITYCRGKVETYHISFTPKNKSFQLVKGHMTINDKTWTIRSIKFEGRSELLRFNCDIQMGMPGSVHEFLPQTYHIKTSYTLAGNKLSGIYRGEMTYQEVRNKSEKRNCTDSPYNLSENFSLSCDPSPYQYNEEIFDSIRKFPFDKSEKNLIADYKKRKCHYDSIARYHGIQQKKKKADLMWDKMNDIFIEDYKWHLNDIGSFRMSPFANPLSFSFSKNEGLEYHQKLSYNKLFQNGQDINLSTLLGYKFKHKEFYWQINSNYQYNSMRDGKINISIGNGNRIYSSDVLEDIQHMADSAINFDFLNLTYFTDLNVHLSNQIEVFHGCNLFTGINIHSRKPVKSPEIPHENVQKIQVKHRNEEISKAIRGHYISFAPNIRIEWTPQYYYYINHNRKYRLHSNFPTFIVEYERAIPNVFGAGGKYEKIETEIQHTRWITGGSKIFYRIGAGFFTNQDETYFVDFSNLHRNNLIANWENDIGGVFQNLDDRWYNASNYYFRLNTVFESPFILLRHVMPYTSHVRSERVYLNLLTMQHLPAHIELGYGIRTFLFNTGVFLSYDKFAKFGIGYKFAFELF